MTTGTEMSWPSWLADLDSELADSLGSIATIHDRLKASVAGGYEYQYPLNAQINAITDRMIADGVVSREVAAHRSVQATRF